MMIIMLAECIVTVLLFYGAEISVNRSEAVSAPE
jgi:hypothetical protein